MHHGNINILQGIKQFLIMDLEIGAVGIFPAFDDGSNLKLWLPGTANN